MTIRWVERLVHEQPAPPRTVGAVAGALHYLMRRRAFVLILGAVYFVAMTIAMVGYLVGLVYGVAGGVVMLAVMYFGVLRRLMDEYTRYLRGLRDGEVTTVIVDRVIERPNALLTSMSTWARRDDEIRSRRDSTTRFVGRLTDGTAVEGAVDERWGDLVRRGSVLGYLMVGTDPCVPVRLCGSEQEDRRRDRVE